MDPSVKAFQDSDRGEPPNGVRMFVPGNEFLCFFENPQCGVRSIVSICFKTFPVIIIVVIIVVAVVVVVVVVIVMIKEKGKWGVRTLQK